MKQHSGKIRPLASIKEDSLPHTTALSAYPSNLPKNKRKDMSTLTRRSGGLAIAAHKGMPFPFKYCLDLVPVDKSTPIEYFYQEIRTAIAQKASIKCNLNISRFECFWRLRKCGK